MKKCLLIGLCIFSSLPAMDNNSQATLQQYLENNQKADNIEAESFLHFIEKNNLEIHDKDILNIGGGCNKVSITLAEKASTVHGIEAKQEVIKYTQQQYPHIKNLSFAQELPSSTYDTVLSFYMNNVKDKKQLLVDINKTLKMNGELFGALFTKENTAPKNCIAALEMLPSILKIMPNLTSQQYLDFVTYSSPCQQEVNDLLKECGFEIILNQEQSHEIALPLEDIIIHQLSILYSRPIYTHIPEEHRLGLIEQYLKCYIDQLSRNENGKYIQPTIMNIIHARKTKEVKEVFIKGTP